MFFTVQLGITKGAWFLSCWASLLNYRWLQITTTSLWCRKWKCSNMLSITQLVMTLPSCCGWKVQAQRWVQHVYWLAFGNQRHAGLPSLQDEWEVMFIHHKLRWATAACEGTHTCGCQSAVQSPELETEAPNIVCGERKAGASECVFLMA